MCNFLVGRMTINESIDVIVIVGKSEKTTLLIHRRRLNFTSNESIGLSYQTKPYTQTDHQIEDFNQAIIDH